MSSLRAVVFDLGDTLVHWPDWDEDAPRRWGLSYDYLVTRVDAGTLPQRDAYVTAMRRAELAHWQRVENEHWSGPPSGLLTEGFRSLGVHAGEGELLAALDGYARAVDGWARVYPDTAPTLSRLHEQGYRLGLLSNTWWAADWHNADLATHGLAPLLDQVVYTSDLPHSKPHPTVFREVAGRLGVAPSECVMVGDRPVDDISGALQVGMRAVWKTNGRPRLRPDHVVPAATITHLTELLPLLERWNGP